MNNDKQYINTGFMELLEDAVQTRIAEKPWMKDRKFKCARNIEEVREFIDNAIRAERCALDLETTSLSTRYEIVDDKRVTFGKIVGFGLCYESKSAFYIPINHREGAEYNLPEDLVLEEIKRLMFNCITIYHNAKFDLSYLKNYGIVLDDHKQFECTLLMAYLHDSGRKQNGLKELSSNLINQPMLKFSEVAKEGRFDLVSPLVGYTYGASDAICTFDLYNFFVDQEIVKGQQLIYNLEKRVTFVVMRMEENLIKVDVPYLEDLKEKVESRIKDAENKIYKLVGYEFNLGSAQQLGKILFDQLGYKYPEKNKTKTGQYITDSKTLEKISDLYPIVKKITEFRGLEKILGTYVNNLLNNHDKDGCVKFNFKQTGTDTGRFSSPGGKGIGIDGCGKVNIQNIPKIPDEANPDIDLRRAFIARPGMTLVAIDYAAEELRVATNVSKETAWIRSFNKGIDFHTATGAIIAGKDPSDITKAERKIGKMVNFLALYLGGAYTLSANAKITIPEAKKILATFFSGVPLLKRWIDREIVKARKLKYVRTVFGRTRPLERYYNSGDKGLASHADRCAVNTIVQGTSADIMKSVMAKLNSWLTLNNLHDEIKVLATVHDELVFEMPTDKIKIYIPEICKIMELKEIIIDQLKWDIPLEVDVEYGDTWRLKKDFFEDFPELKKRLKEPLMKFVPLQKRKEKKEKDKNDKPPVENSKVEGENLKESNKKVPETQPDVKEEVPKPPDIDNDKQDVVSEKPIIEINEEKDIKKNEEIPEVKEEVKVNGSDQYLIFTLKELSTTTLRWLNGILAFLTDEADQYDEKTKKILKIRDRTGNSLLVSELKIHVDSFLVLARYFGI